MPTGTGAETATIRALMEQMAGVGEVCIGPGTCSLIAPSGAEFRPSLDFSPDVLTGGPLVFACHPNTAFAQNRALGTSQPLVCGIGGSLIETTTWTLQSAPAVGALTISIDGEPDVGDYLTVGTYGLYRQQLMKVMAVSGAGPYTVTLDRPIRWAHLSGAEVRLATPMKDHKLYGNGALMYGPGARYIEIIGAWGMALDDWRFDAGHASGGCDERLMSIDLASYQTSMRKLVGDCADVTGLGLSFESSDACMMQECIARRATSNAIWLQDAIAPMVLYCEGTESNVGLGVAKAVGGAEATLDAQIIGGKYTNNATGISVDGQARNTVISGCEISDNSTQGIGINAGAVGTTITGGTQLARNVKGISIPSGCLGTKVLGVDLLDNSSYALDLSDELMVQGCYIRGPTSGPSQLVIVRAGGAFRATGMEMLVRNVAFGVDVIASSGAKVFINNSVIRLGSNNAIGVAARAACEVTVENTRITKNASETGTIGLYSTGVGACVRYRNCDLSGVATATSTASSGATNRGTVTCNGTTPVAVAYAAITARDMVILSKKTTGGTPGLAPFVTITAGTGFSVTAEASDTCDYDYMII